MKKNFIISSMVLLAITIIGLSSCKKEDSVINASMSAKIDGVKWTSLFRATTVNSNTNIVVVSGAPAITIPADQTIILTIKGTEARTYKLSPIVGELSSECLIVYQKTADATDSTSVNYFVSYSAEVAITKYDATNKKISGTFKGDLYPKGNPSATKLVISEGKFENLNFISSK